MSHKLLLFSGLYKYPYGYRIPSRYVAPVAPVVKAVKPVPVPAPVVRSVPLPYRYVAPVAPVVKAVKYVPGPAPVLKKVPLPYRNDVPVIPVVKTAVKAVPAPAPAPVPAPAPAPIVKTEPVTYTHLGALPIHHTTILRETTVL